VTRDAADVTHCYVHAQERGWLLRTLGIMQAAERLGVFKPVSRYERKLGKGGIPGFADEANGDGASVEAAAMRSNNKQPQFR